MGSINPQTGLEHFSDHLDAYCADAVHFGATLVPEGAPLGGFVADLALRCVRMVREHSGCASPGPAVELAHRMSHLLLWYKQVVSAPVSRMCAPPCAATVGNGLFTTNYVAGVTPSSGPAEAGPTPVYPSQGTNTGVSHVIQTVEQEGSLKPRSDVCGQVRILRSLVPTPQQTVETLRCFLKPKILRHGDDCDVKAQGRFFVISARSRPDLRRLNQWAYGARTEGVLAAVEAPPSVATSGNQLWKVLRDRHVLRNPASSRSDIRNQFTVSVRSKADKKRLAIWIQEQARQEAPLTSNADEVLSAGSDNIKDPVEVTLEDEQSQQFALRILTTSEEDSQPGTQLTADDMRGALSSGQYLTQDCRLQSLEPHSPGVFDIVLQASSIDRDTFAKAIQTSLGWVVVDVPEPEAESPARPIRNLGLRSGPVSEASSPRGSQEADEWPETESVLVNAAPVPTASATRLTRSRSLGPRP